MNESSMVAVTSRGWDDETKEIHAGACLCESVSRDERNEIVT